MMAPREVDELGIGDKVFYNCGGEMIVTVSRRTATQVVLSNGVRINRSGRVVGKSSWHRSYVTKWTAEREAELEAQRKRNRIVSVLRDVNWTQQSDDCLAAVADAIKLHSLAPSKLVTLLDHVGAGTAIGQPDRVQA